MRSLHSLYHATRNVSQSRKKRPARVPQAIKAVCCEWRYGEEVREGLPVVVDVGIGVVLAEVVLFLGAKMESNGLV